MSRPPTQLPDKPGSAPDVVRHPREISPAILAVATILFLFALLLMATVEWLRQRGSSDAAL